MTTIDDRRQFPTAGTIAAAATDYGRGNVIRLAIAQALAGANSTVVYATGAILGNTLAPDKALILSAKSGRLAECDEGRHAGPGTG